MKSASSFLKLLSLILLLSFGLYATERSAICVGAVASANSALGQLFLSGKTPSLRQMLDSLHENRENLDDSGRQQLLEQVYKIAAVVSLPAEDQRLFFDFMADFALSKSESKWKTEAEIAAASAPPKKWNDQIVTMADTELLSYLNQSPAGPFVVLVKADYCPACRQTDAALQTVLDQEAGKSPRTKIIIVNVQSGSPVGPLINRQIPGMIIKPQSSSQRVQNGALNSEAWMKLLLELEGS